jgi:AcrR family transcriptional regulator
MAFEAGQKKDGPTSIAGVVAEETSQYHHGDLRNALIRAGLEILRSDGSQALSLREAARTAGVSQAAPYRHFKNKEALLAAIAEEGFRLLGDRIRSAVQAFRMSPEEQFHQTALAYLKLAREHADHFRLMFAGMPKRCPKDHPGLDRVSKELFNEFVSIIIRCQREKVIRAGNPEQLALVAWCSVHGFAALLVNESLRFLSIPVTQTELAMRALTRNLLDGLKPN